MSVRGTLRRRLWLALPVLAAVYVLAVLGATRWLDGERVDLTQDHLYTLAPGTRDILSHLQQPLQLTLYFSDRASTGLPQVRAYHQRVLGMLREVVRHSHGRVQLAEVDPLPFSEDEDRAVAAGLTSVRADGAVEPIFFGLAARDASSGRSAAIPSFLFAKEQFLEYDIARLLYTLSVAHKPRVAIYSTLPLWGGNDADGNAQPEWAVLQQARQLFDVVQLDTASLAALPANLDVLVLVQPTHLADADVRAIDRYVQRGGRLLVFVDPDSEVGGGDASNLPKLFHAWGVAFDPRQVVLDRSRALTVQSPLTGAPERHPGVLGLTAEEMNRRDPVTRMLALIDVASSGNFGLLPDSTTRLQPLLQSTTDAMLVATDRERDAGDPADLFKDYAPSGEHYAIAVELQGKLAAALPGDAPAKPGRAPRVILVADTDLLSDRLWVQESAAGRQAMLSAFANNGDFFVNAIDDLAGPSDLIAIRGRAVVERKFTRVDALRRQADERFKSKQSQLLAELNDTEQRLAALKQNAHARGASAAQKSAVEEFMQRKLAIRDELRAVQRNLDADIERLSMRLKFVDILLMPLLVALLGLLYGAWRARRRRSGSDWQ